MKLPRTLDLRDALDAEGTAIYAGQSVRERVQFATRSPLLPALQSWPAMKRLVVVGGGTKMDEAKAWREDNAPDVELVAIPSIWGSGAEASPVAVLWRDGRKVIRIGGRLLPDARSLWPQLADTISSEGTRHACGDCWAHALEGFLSPLAESGLRAELAELMREMLQAPIGRDPRWFEWSACACAGLAGASAGLVHGIAHTIERRSPQGQAKPGWGHARLCSLFLWPVMQFNKSASNRWSQLTEQYQLDADRLLAAARSLWDESAYRTALPEVRRHWNEILHDRCTRTNSALVRPHSLVFFERGILS